MDPLSVLSGIVGIVAASSQLITTLWKLHNDLKDAAEETSRASEELSHITTIVQGLQKYVQGQAVASPERLQLITFEQITATITGCVMTMSELNETVKSLYIDPLTRAWWRWPSKKKKVNSLITRLQYYKNTFATMLNILQCAALTTAERNMERLGEIMSEILNTDQELVSRMRNLERLNEASMASGSISIRDSQSIGGAITNAGPSDYRGVSSARALTSSDSVRPFELFLRGTRPYRRAADNNSLFSCEAESSILRSLATTVTLDEVSNISVYALPVYLSELSNASCYIAPGLATITDMDEQERPDAETPTGSPSSSPEIPSQPDVILVTTSVTISSEPRK